MFLIISNIGFAAPAAYSGLHGHFRLAVLYTLTMFVSVVYHSATESGRCLIDDHICPDSMKKLDHIMSSISVIETFTFLFDGKWRGVRCVPVVLSEITRCLCILIIIDNISGVLSTELVMSIVPIVNGIYTLLVRRFISVSLYPFIAGTVIMIFAGITYYLADNYEYDTLHSVWHLMAAAGALCVVASRTKKTVSLVI